MDRGAWWAAVHGVAQSRTRLKQLSMHVLEREMATHSSGLVWRIPGTQEPGWAAICRVAQSQTRLMWLSSSSSSSSRLHIFAFIYFALGDRSNNIVLWFMSKRVGLSYMISIMLKYVSFIPTSLIQHHIWMSNFVKRFFSVFINMIIWFLLFNLLICGYWPILAYWPIQESLG